MSMQCGLWQRKLPFAAGMGSATRQHHARAAVRGPPVRLAALRLATSAAVAAANGRP